MEKPAIVLVHGFWGGAAHWNAVINALKAQGYTDVYAVENTLTSLADDGRAHTQNGGANSKTCGVSGAFLRR